MEKYENLGMVGEGSYGVVIKCKHKESGQVVAIKKFLDTEDDRTVKKIALREIRMLKQLRHDNLVNLIETFRKKKRLYLVFEYVDHTVLDEIERHPKGLDEATARKLLFQVVRGTEFCHVNNIIHRDVKPENILVSKLGVVKLCDFGFARPLAPTGESHTDYVATRWYRAPELLVGDTKYGKPVDIWAIGCLFSEMLTSEPLFPGESDLDQLYLILRCFGSISPRHRELFYKNNLFAGKRLPEPKEITPLERRVPRASPLALDLLKQSLLMEPDDRPTSTQLMRHEFFQRDNWASRFIEDLQGKVQRETETNPLLKQQLTAGAGTGTGALAGAGQTPRQSQAAPPLLPVQAQVQSSLASVQAPAERESRSIAQPSVLQQLAARQQQTFSNVPRSDNTKKMPIQFQMQLMQQQQQRKTQQLVAQNKNSGRGDDSNDTEERDRDVEAQSSTDANGNADTTHKPHHTQLAVSDSDVDSRDREKQNAALSLPPAAQNVAFRSPGASIYSLSQLPSKSQDKQKKSTNVPIQFLKKPSTLPQGSYYHTILNYHTMHQESRQPNFLYNSQTLPRKNPDSLLPDVRGLEANKTIMNLSKFKKGLFSTENNTLDDDGR